MEVTSSTWEEGRGRNEWGHQEFGESSNERGHKVAMGRSHCEVTEETGSLQGHKGMQVLRGSHVEGKIPGRTFHDQKGHDSLLRV